ncbi:NnrU family protein [Pseudemcibacter aquimaris]|uniref:NnrU family protein n=1 Tax=Pseudemcibacter aquimaris TaxID=2857064 RepID=UPI002012CDD6|nr:NnrU family protein [Pseudemcibacter aquimaris]MCC3859867.1 NnrU family protein [Pseudemcibacter aquimaris]WDU57199.1 NnrU family protein [Pseudemcibacter aquimaris]
MGLLIAGVLLWSVVHLMPAALPNFRNSLAQKMGNGYRGLFALLILLSLVMIVMGWRSTIPAIMYDVPDGAVSTTSLFMIISIFLFGAANGDSNVKRHIRHPMLMGMILWGAGHLISNGENRSIILFGGLACWAALEIIMLNMRDREYERPAPVPLKKDIIRVVVAIAVYAVLVFAHPYFTGMPVMVM